MHQHWQRAKWHSSVKLARDERLHGPESLQQLLAPGEFMQELSRALGREEVDVTGCVGSYLQNDAPLEPKSGELGY